MLRPLSTALLLHPLRRYCVRQRFTTLELKVNYTRPITKEAGTLRCEASVVHIGGRTATSEGRIVDAQGKVFAHGTTTCIVVERVNRAR